MVAHQGRETSQETERILCTDVEEKFDKNISNKKKTMQEKAGQIGKSKTKIDDLFTDIENLASWKVEVDDRAKIRKKNKALIEETACKVEESQKRTENMFSHIQNLALRKEEVEGRTKISQQNKTLKKEIACKVEKSQERAKNMLEEIQNLALWKSEVESRAKVNKKQCVKWKNHKRGQKTCSQKSRIWPYGRQNMKVEQQNMEKINY